MTKKSKPLVQGVYKYPYTYKGKETLKYQVRFEYYVSDGSRKRITKMFESDAKANANRYLRELKAEFGDKKSRQDSFDNAETTIGGFQPVFEEGYASQKVDKQGLVTRSKEAVKYFGADTQLKHIRRRHLEEYRKHIASTNNEKSSRGNKPRTAKTVDDYLKTLQMMMEYAVVKDAMRKEDVPSFKKGLFKTAEYGIREETIDFVDFLKLLKACDVPKRDRLHFEHLKLTLVGLHQLACRLSELQKIKVKDIDGRIMTVEEGKLHNGKVATRSAYISDFLMKYLEESGILSADKEEYVFGSSYPKKSFKTAKEIAGTDDGREKSFWMKDLRRTGITHLVQSGMSLPSIQKQVGHRANSAMTLDIYTRLHRDFIIEENQKQELRTSKLYKEAMKQIENESKK